MNIKTITVNNIDIAIVQDGACVITYVQSALDLAVTLQYEYGCSRIILNRDAFAEDFFNLSTRLAGDILQKYTNYSIKLAVVGDFSIIKSNALHDFIRESNRGNSFFFVPNEEDAIERLSKAP